MLMGVRSLFVMLKLGFELRSSYEPLMEERLPDHLQRLVEQLPGAGDGVGVELRPAQPLF